LGKGKKNTLKKKYENCVEKNSYLCIFKVACVGGGCLKCFKMLTCGNLEPNFPPMAFLYCVKQSSGPAEALTCSSEDCINAQQAADASCRQNGNQYLCLHSLSDPSRCALVLTVVHWDLKQREEKYTTSMWLVFCSLRWPC